jgi:ATP phosphoribosyltransferase
VLKMAIPTGRMGEAVIEALERTGLDCRQLKNGSRKLIQDLGSLQIIRVKPSDVAVYVEHGVADVGIIGKDILLETEPDVFELFDLGFGACRMSVAAPKGYEDPGKEILRVATKYPHTATKHFAAKNRPTEIIALNGSIEIAPLVGLSHVIVDIVETGTTLRENGLEIVEVIAPSSARCIANKASYQFKRDEIDALLAAWSEK